LPEARNGEGTRAKASPTRQAFGKAKRPRAFSLPAVPDRAPDTFHSSRDARAASAGFCGMPLAGRSARSSGSRLIDIVKRVERDASGIDRMREARACRPERIRVRLTYQADEGVGRPDLIRCGLASSQ